MTELGEVEDFAVRPCVNGNSSAGFHFNFSSCDGANCTTALNAQPGASIISPIILSLAGISGQICALIYLYRSTRPSNHRTTFYVLLATLIWTDLIGKLITTPLPVMAYAKGHWVGGSLTCNIHGFFMSIIGIITHLLVAVMALERYLGIRCGYFYNRNVTTSRTRIVLLGIWVLGVCFCTFPLMGVGEFKLHFPGSWCHINQHICSDQSLVHRIYANLYTSINLLCFFIIVICNLVVVGSLLQMRMKQLRPSVSCPIDPNQKKPKEREIQMVILLVVITVTFTISWAAHDLLMIKNQIWPVPPNESPIWDIKAIRLVSLNQIIDPWSYIICRIVFRSKLWRCCRRVFVGSLSVRRYSSTKRGNEGGSVFSSMGLVKRRLNKNYKRASLPNPNDMAAKPITENMFQSVDNNKSSFDQSYNSDLDQSCSSKSRIEDRLVPRSKRTSLSATLAKLFKTSNQETYIQIDLPENGSKNLALLSPNSFSNPSKTSSEKFFFKQGSSFHGETRITSSVSDCDEDESYQHLLNKKGFGSSSGSLTRRSNSWCCPNQYTIRSHQK